MLLLEGNRSEMVLLGLRDCPMHAMPGERA